MGRRKLAEALRRGHLGACGLIGTGAGLALSAKFSVTNFSLQARSRERAGITTQEALPAP
jgi:hypothetical protein